MYKLSIQNEYGKTLELSNNANYSIVSITGLNPPSATINTSTITNFDGARYNSARVNMRNIVITLNPEFPVERNRIALYEYFKTKHWVRVFYSNASRDVYIDGYVETFECDQFTQKQQAQISILCPQPFFIGLGDTNTTHFDVIPLFEVPFSLPTEGMALSEYIANEPIEFVNSGDVSSGMLFTFTFQVNTVELTLTDTFTGETFIVEYEFLPYDLLEINTNKGEKSITLTRNGKKINLINYVTVGSQWLQSHLGPNSFVASTIEGVDFSVDINWLTLYEGV